MERPTCKTCAFWEKYHPLDEERDVALGQCRRYAPTACLRGQFGIAEDGEAVIGGVGAKEVLWPLVFVGDDEDDWCGEHPNFPAYLASLKNAEEPKDNGWIKVEERVPESDDPCLVVTKDKKIVGYPRRIELWNLPSTTWFGAEVTHWQPLPELPGE